MECIYETLQMAKSYRDVSETRKTTPANFFFFLIPLPETHVVYMLSSLAADNSLTIRNILVKTSQMAKSY